MSLSTLIARAGQECAIEVDATADLPAQTAMGGANRTGDNWVTVADAVPCLIQVTGTRLEPDQNGQRVAVTSARIYLAEDPVPGGLNVRHRIRTTLTGAAGPRVAGTWAVTGVVDPIPSGHHLEVEAQRTGTP